MPDESKKRLDETGLLASRIRKVANLDKMGMGMFKIINTRLNRVDGPFVTMAEAQLRLRQLNFESPEFARFRKIQRF